MKRVDKKVNLLRKEVLRDPYNYEENEHRIEQIASRLLSLYVAQLGRCNFPPKPEEIGFFRMFLEDKERKYLKGRLSDISDEKKELCF